MSSRFAAGLHKLKDVSGKPAKAAPEPEALEPTRPTGRAYEAPPSRQGKVAISAYFDPAVRKQFAILAVKEDRSQSALLAEAINLVFEKYGEPPIASA